MADAVPVVDASVTRPRTRPPVVIVVLLVVTILAIALVFRPVVLMGTVDFVFDHPMLLSFGLVAVGFACFLSVLELRNRSRRGHHVAWLIVAAWTLGSIVLPFMLGGFFEAHPLVAGFALVFFGLAGVQGLAGIRGRFHRGRQIACRLFVLGLSVTALTWSVDWFSLNVRGVAIGTFVESGEVENYLPLILGLIPTVLFRTYFLAGLISVGLSAGGVRETLCPGARYRTVFLSCLGVAFAGMPISLFRYMATFET